VCSFYFCFCFSYDAPCIHVLSVSFAHFFRSTVVVMSLSVTLISGACMSIAMVHISISTRTNVIDRFVLFGGCRKGAETTMIIKQFDMYLPSQLNSTSHNHLNISLIELRQHGPSSVSGSVGFGSHAIHCIASTNYWKEATARHCGSTNDAKSHREILS
jgi:hypothetical protein